MRNLQVEGTRLLGTVTLSSLAERSWTLIKEGHQTDLSVGYRTIKKRYIAPGETAQVDGRTWKGPVNLIEEWQVKEVSLTPIGADATSKLRSEKGTELMDPETLAMLRQRGLPADATDDDAKAFLKKILTAPAGAGLEGQPGQRSDSVAAGQTGAPRTDDVGRAVSEAKTPVAQPVDLDALVSRALGEALPKLLPQVIDQRAQQAAARDAEIRSLCQLAGLEDRFEQCRTMPTVDEVRKYLLEQKSQVAAVRPVIQVTGEGRERFWSDMSTALTLRAMDLDCQDAVDLQEGEQRADNSMRTRAAERVFPTAQRSKGAGVERMRRWSLKMMAEEAVRMEFGLDARNDNLSEAEICQIALFGTKPFPGLRARSDAGMNNAGMFPNIMLEAMHKTMRMAYLEAPFSWQKVFRRGEPVSDFRNIHRIQMGVTGNIPVWDGVSEPNEERVADSREYYAIEAYSAKMSFGWKALIQDSMAVLRRQPMGLGQSMSRTVNALAWSQITQNPTLSDGVALFSTSTTTPRFRPNLVAAVGAPSTSTLQTLTAQMMMMRALNTPEATESAAILGLQPRYLAGPVALRTTILQLIKSAFDPVDANQKFNTATGLEPVIEPLLDAASTSAWYLFADPNAIDTVEVTFLQGQETPQMRQETSIENLSIAYYILQSVGAKALDYRGLQKHNNA